MSKQDKKAAADKKPGKPPQPKETAGMEHKVKNKVGLPLTIHAQYVRDASFENPLAPQALRGGQSTPKIQIDFNMEAHELDGGDLPDMYEVVLTVRAEGKRDDKTVFIAEVQYGTTVSVSEVPKDKQHALLLIEVPRLAFPYVREIISDMTVKGGYPPLLLQPVNFHRLYLDKFAVDPEPEEKSAAQ